MIPGDDDNGNNCRICSIGNTGSDSDDNGRDVPHVVHHGLIKGLVVTASRVPATIISYEVCVSFSDFSA